jgi:hypothetical protein
MRHLCAAGVWLLASVLLCSCATTRRAADGAEDSEALEAFLDSGPAGLVCDGTRLVGATSFSATCLPTEEGVLLTAKGLESLSEPLRQCVLSSLPVETGGVDPTACQRGAAQVLQGRLRQLGWLDAAAAPAKDTASPRQAHLEVQLGARYQVGPMSVERNEYGRVDPERILVKARAAAPEGSWYTTTVLAAIYARVFQMKKFNAVWVVGGEPNREGQFVPVTIDVWEKGTGKSSKKEKEPRPEPPTARPKKPVNECPRRGSICLNGRDCVFDKYLGCTICACRPARW